MDLAPDFSDLLEEFALAGVEFVVVGGYAVAFHARPRATKDLDIVLGGSPENLSKAADALARFGAPANVVSATRSLTPDEVVYMGQPPLRVDFLRTIEGVEPEALFRRAVPATVSGVAIKVISLDDLITNKRAVGRAQDVADAELLERVRTRGAKT